MKWKMVPVEPTEKMIDKGYRMLSGKLPDIYRAMLAAAPEAPPAGEDREQMQECREALKAFLAAMDEFGDWDDGYFFYVGRAAPELHTPIRLANAAIRAAEGKQSQPKEQG